MDDFTTKSLCGVGMVYKFCKYLDERLGVSYADKYLDLVALGEIADVMDERDYETRYLTNLGIDNVNNAFLRNMCERQAFSMGGKITITGIAWYIAPLINAVNRIGTLEERKLLFEAMLDENAYKIVPSTKRGHGEGEMERLVDQAVRVVGSVKNRQTKIQDKMVQQVNEIVEENQLYNDKIIVVRNDKLEGGANGLTGLVAAKVATKYGHPTILLNPTQMDDELHWGGSARSLGGFNIRDYVETSGLADFAAGHNFACGASFPAATVDDFIARANKDLAGYDFSNEYAVEGKFSANNIPLSDGWSIAESDWVWAQNVDEPLFLFTGFRATQDNTFLMGKNQNTVKFLLPNEVNAIKFGSNYDEYQSLLGQEIGFIGTFSINEFNGSRSLQIKIKDWESKPVESKWVF